MLCSHRRMKISVIVIGILTLVAQVEGQEDPEDYISIDCGAPNDYHDDNLDIYYKTDVGFIDTGENMQVSPKFFNNESYNRQLENLRTFPNGTRNCYTLRPKQGKGNTYLVRATFWYGNYDGKNQTPIFHLYIDTNYWTTSTKNTNHTYTEVIYITPRDYIQVCLVNIGSGVPFISTLELRLLDNSTYNKIPLSGALQTYSRNNIGSMSNFSFRHPQDVYDRIWPNRCFPGKITVNNTTTVANLTRYNAYKVPQEVLMTAQQTRSRDEDFVVHWTSFGKGHEWYAYFHFAEVQDLKGQVREMKIYMNDVYVDTIRLQNQVPQTVVSVPVTGVQKINCTLRATSRSDLPPLLNAMEIFRVLDLPNSRTDLSDFDSINAIKKTYGIDKESWQGDPCFPESMKWEALNCSYDGNAPRIISLNLSSGNLAGTIVNSFSNLTAITSLDLSNNNLNGSVPGFLTRMPFLKVINLTSNNLSGIIPKELLQKNRTGSLLLRLDGNQSICLSGSCGGNNKSKRVVIFIVVAIVAPLLMLVTFATIKYLRVKKKAQGFTRIKVEPKNKVFTFSELTRITNNFEICIGEGGFGKVYLGKLEDRKVAIKMLSQTSKQGVKEFEEEARLLSVVHHKNLVSLIGYCDDSEHLALIYEYMSNKDLRQHLSEQNINVLTWRRRLEIAINAAQGLDYLHNGCRPSIVHRDLKTSNILLNESMQAKIADFGLSKTFKTEFDTHISTRPAGTFGYLDPGCVSSHFNKKSDVYSFGIILLELISGKPAVIANSESVSHIAQWVTPLVENHDIDSIVDRRLQGRFNQVSAQKMIDVAMQCVRDTRDQRPDMNCVLSNLKECMEIETSEINISFEAAELDSFPSPR